MSATMIVVIVAFCVGLSGAVLANIFVAMMIGEIDRQRPESDLLSYFGFTPLKMLRILREYRALYPQGRLYNFVLAAFVSMSLMA